MAETLNIALTADQAAWVKGRKEQGGFASTSEVMRDLIRNEQQKESAALKAEFEQLSKDPSSPGPEPVEEIVQLCRQVRKERRAAHESHRRS